MKRLIMFAVVLALFGTGVAVTLVVPEPPYVSSKGVGGTDTRAEGLLYLPEGPDHCFPPPPGIEGPDCR
jgi:hypothetical protein